MGASSWVRARRINWQHSRLKVFKERNRFDWGVYKGCSQQRLGWTRRRQRIQVATEQEQRIASRIGMQARRAMGRRCWVGTPRQHRVAGAEEEGEQEQSRNFEKFQLLAKYSQNDGLFFTSLYGAPRAIAYRSGSLAKENAVITSSISKEDLTRGYKQILYGGLSLVFVSFMWSSGSAFLSGTCMRASKLMSYGVIMSLLLMQLAYAKVLTGEADTAKEIDTAEEIEDAAD